MGQRGCLGKLTDQEKLSIVDEYTRGDTAYFLSKKYAVSPSSIVSILKVRKVKFHGKRKYAFDMNYFDIIDTEEKAYWLGFLYAEGNLHRSTLAIKLHQNDEKHLLAFKNSIQSEHFIKPIKNKKAVVFKIHWNGFPEKLKKVGIFPNKHAKIKYPDIEKKIDMHFIRGFFDGDGWITHYQPKNMIQEAWQVGFASASEEFIISLREKLFDKGSLYKREYVTKKGIKKSCFQLLYTGNLTTGLVMSKLYENSTISLERKYELYKNFCNQRNFVTKERTVKQKLRNRDSFGRFCKMDASYVDEQYKPKNMPFEVEI